MTAIVLASTRNNCLTYSDNRRIIWYLRRLVLLGRPQYGQVLDIAPFEDDIFVDIIRTRHLFRRIAATALGPKRANIFKRDCRAFRIDLMKCTNVAASDQYPMAFT